MRCAEARLPAEAEERGLLQVLVGREMLDYLWTALFGVVDEGSQPACLCTHIQTEC